VVRVSAGTAAVLGLRRYRLLVPPTTAYLMVGEGCRYSCAFCPQAQASAGRRDRLSRVVWPPAAKEEVVLAVREAARAGKIKRVCLQVVHSRGIWAPVLDMVTALAACGLPVCVSCSPATLRRIGQLLEVGADGVTIPLDAACCRVYRAVKSGSWQRRWQLLEGAAVRFPGRIGTHLIVGLGETEREMLECLQRLHDQGVRVGLFAFTPVRGTPLAQTPPPPVGTYRRIQAGWFLIRTGACSYADMRFAPDGRVVDYGLASQQLEELLKTGEAFRTTGCPDCNRPYYNERPGGVVYNYPRPLTEAEARECILQMEECGEEDGDALALDR